MATGGVRATTPTTSLVVSLIPTFATGGLAATISPPSMRVVSHNGTHFSFGATKEKQNEPRIRRAARILLGMPRNQSLSGYAASVNFRKHSVPLALPRQGNQPTR